MAKKLTVEVDADVSSARRKLKSLSDEIGGGGDSSRVAPSAERAAKSLEITAQSADKLSRRAAEGSARIKEMSKVFGGMAIRMAAGYAANQMEPGSTAQKAVKGVGEVASGALMGSAFGPLGALAGGLMGLTSAIMEASAAEKQRQDAINSEKFDFYKSERDYASDKKWAEKLKGLTQVEQGFTDFSARIAAINEELSHYKDVEAEMTDKIKEFIQNGDLDDARLQRQYLARNRARQSQLESAKERMEAMRDEHRPTSRTSTAALDAMARLGLGGGGESGRESLAVQREMSATLKSIDQKTRPGGGTWQ